MYTSYENPRVGDRVRLTGFLGIFEVVRIFQNGSLVDLKHLDLHGTDYIEQEVSVHDILYVGPAQPKPAAQAPTSAPATVARRPSAQAAPQRSAQQAGSRF